MRLLKFKHKILERIVDIAGYGILLIFGVLMTLFTVIMDFATATPVVGMLGFFFYSLPKILEHRKTRVFVKRHVWVGALPVIYLLFFVYSSEARFNEVKKGHACIISALEKYRSSQGIYPDDLALLNSVCNVSAVEYYDHSEARDVYWFIKHGHGYTTYEYSSANKDWLRSNSF